MKKYIDFIDCTLREGEQACGVFFSREEKVHLLTLLSGAGLGVADAGMPAVSDDEFKTIKELTRLDLDIKIGVSVRARKEEVDLGLKCGAQEIFLIVPTSLLHLQKKIKSSEAEIKELSRALVGRIKKAGVTANLVAEDSSRSSPDFIVSLFENASEEGVDRVFLCDTVGVMIPSLMKKFIKEIKDCLSPKVHLGVHCHNDFGLATANTIAAIEEGATFPTGTINGVGERVGNVPLQEIVMATEKLLKLKHKIDIKKLVAISPIVEQYTGILLSQQTPVVGYNVFRHESGIHVDGIIKDNDIYEPFSPEEIGKKRAFVLGKHSGKAYLRYLLKKKGLKHTEEDLSQILCRVKEEKQTQDKKSFLALKQEINSFNEKILGFSESRFWEIVKDILT